MSVKLERRAIPVITLTVAIVVFFGGDIIEWVVDTLYAAGLNTDDVVKLTAVTWCSTVAAGIALMYRRNTRIAAAKAKAKP